VRTATSFIVRLILAAAGCLVLSSGIGAQQNSLSGLIPFESYLESLRVQAGIPGMSAILLQDGEVVWERGLGFQNQESRIRATPDTPYPIADLNQTLAATLVLHCTEQRRLALADPIRRYGESVAEPNATIRQLLSHTSANSGDAFQYDPERFAKLTRAVETCIEQPYRKTVAVELLERFAMKDSVPGRDVLTTGTSNQPLFATEVIERYRRVLDRLAVPYKVDKRGRLTRSELQPEGINAASGLVSTVRDLARFDAALDTGLLIREDTRNMAWSNVQSSQNTAIPTGLGWFVQNYRDDRVVWHFGLVPNAYSSLIIKLPARRLTFILLANSDGLSAPFQLDQGDITRSLFATLFLRLYT
jgi:CubicO group peptidase (beta-lactamase class C family)